jgi:hypothetical protein
MINLRAAKTMAITAAAVAALFAAGWVARSPNTVAAEGRATDSPSAATKPAKPVPWPTATHTPTVTPPPSTAVQADMPPSPTPSSPAPQPGSGLSDTTPASSSTPAPPPVSFGPPPCAFGVCVPWVWYQATSVVNNNALLPVPAFGSSMDNNTAGPAMLTDMVQGTVQVAAQLAGTVGLSPSAQDIAGAIAQLTPQVSAQAQLQTTKTVEVTVPQGDKGVITFGVPAVLVKGYVHTRGVFGHVTSTPLEAWAPLYPTVFGFSAYVQPLVGNGPQSEVPVIPVPDF